MLTRIGLYRNVCVGRFSVDGGGQFSICFPLEVDIEEGYGAVFLIFLGELYSGVDLIETLDKGLGGISRIGGVAA